MARPQMIDRRLIGSLVFAAFVVYAVAFLLNAGRPLGVVALIGAWVAVAIDRWRTVAILATSALLQLAYFGIVYADQVDLGAAAFERARTGLSPYGVMYINDEGGLNPFAYGPLALLTSLGGRPLEFAAHMGVLVLLARERAAVTLGIMAAGPMVLGSTHGGNDGIPALLLGVALLTTRTHPHSGMLLLAIAAAIKPHIAAWFLPMIGFAGPLAAAWLAGATIALWSPLLVWGVGTYVQSATIVYGAGGEHTESSLGLNFPWVRPVSAVLALAGLWARRWETAVLIGAAAYILLMFFGAWAHWGYVTAPLLAAGLALESQPRVNARGNEQ